MTATFSKEAADYVEAQIRAGAFKSPEEFIDHAVALERGREILAAYPPAEIEAWLLEAVDSPRTAWRGRQEMEEILTEIRERPSAR
jgi:Arc/MetJ-type ribon-helix-helix transcriptional regulator